MLEYGFQTLELADQNEVVRLLALFLIHLYKRTFCK